MKAEEYSVRTTKDGKFATTTSSAYDTVVVVVGAAVAVLAVTVATIAVEVATLVAVLVTVRILVF